MTPLASLDQRVWQALQKHGSAFDYRPSPNYNHRPGTASPDALIIHYTALEMAPSVAHLTSQEAGVSTHYVIDRDGTLVQLVPVGLRAWHAGVSTLAGSSDVNGRSVGLDLVYIPGVDRQYTDVQYRVLALLTRALMAELPIDERLIVGHEHVARPRGRKFDPGPDFDWTRYFSEAGVDGALDDVLPPRG